MRGVGGLGQALGGWGGVVSVCVVSLDYLRRWQVPVFNPVAPYRYLLHNLYFSVADITYPEFLACGSRTWISLDIVRFYEEHC